MITIFAKSRQKIGRPMQKATDIGKAKNPTAALLY
jgi:hypothetical protein